MASCRGASHLPLYRSPGKCHRREAAASAAKLAGGSALKMGRKTATRRTLFHSPPPPPPPSSRFAAAPKAAVTDNTSSGNMAKSARLSMLMHAAMSLASPASSCSIASSSTTPGTPQSHSTYSSTCSSPAVTNGTPASSKCGASSICQPSPSDDVADLLDQLERGESTAVLSRPLRPAMGRWKRFQVLHEDDSFQFINEGTGKVVLTAKRVGRDFYISQDEDFPATFSGAATRTPHKKAKTLPFCCVLRFNAAMQGYNLFSTSCEHCDGLMGKYACNYNSHTVERQLLGTILQRIAPLANGAVSARQLKVTLPPVDRHSNSRIVWCPRQRAHGYPVAVKVLFGSPSGVCGSQPALPCSPPFLPLYSPDKRNPAAPCRLSSVLPLWDEGKELLTLEFPSTRKMMSSRKNFLLVSDKTKRGIIQMGKMGPGLYSLDFRFPVAPVQAFATMLSTFDWDESRRIAQ